MLYVPLYLILKQVFLDSGSTVKAFIEWNRRKKQKTKQQNEI